MIGCCVAMLRSHWSAVPTPLFDNTAAACLLHLQFVEGFIFCISATPHLETSFPLFHAFHALFWQEMQRSLIWPGLWLRIGALVTSPLTLCSYVYICFYQRSGWIRILQLRYISFDSNENCLYTVINRSLHFLPCTTTGGNTDKKYLQTYTLNSY